MLSLDGMQITCVVNFKEETRKGKKYYKIKQFRIKIAIENAHFDFKNLFNGEKQLGDNVLNVLNENGLVLFEDVKEGVQNAYAEIAKNIAARLFHNIPVDEIFLP